MIWAIRLFSFVTLRRLIHKHFCITELSLLILELSSVTRLLVKNLCHSAMIHGNIAFTNNYHILKLKILLTVTYLLKKRTILSWSITVFYFREKYHLEDIYQVITLVVRTHSYAHQEKRFCPDIDITSIRRTRRIHKETKRRKGKKSAARSDYPPRVPRALLRREVAQRHGPLVNNRCQLPHLIGRCCRGSRAGI